MTEPRPADAAAIAEAAALIRGGGLVAFPTETVYGLGCDATSDRAVARVFAAKDRPSFNPLIVHLADVEAAARLAEVSAFAWRLAARFWPGPLTLVLPRRGDCSASLLACAGLDTIALRVPDHPVAHALIVAAGRPIAAPSANRSGEISPTTADHVARSLGDAVDMILDGGACRVGIESTVVDMTQSPPAILRPGAVTMEAIEAEIGRIATAAPVTDGRPRAPGMLERHYAPYLPLRLEATEAAPGEALLGFGPAAPAGTAANLSVTGELTEAAANLFAMLRALDRPDLPGHRGIAVMAIPDRGVGRAINDRLRRAAAPRLPPR